MYNPNLQSTPTPMQYNATPSFLGVVDSLVGLGLEGFGAQQAQPRQPTADEAFANDWIAFSNSQPAARAVDMTYARDFAARYPQHGNKAFEYTKGQGVPEKPQEEMNRDVFMDWKTTPAGTLAQQTAMGMEPEKRDAFLWEQYGIELKQTVELANLNRDKAKFEAEGILQTKQWEVLLPQASAITDNAINSIIHPILIEIQKGGTVQLSPEEAQTIGTRLTEVNAANLPLFLNEAKTQLKGMYASSYKSNFGVESVPPKDMEERLLGSLNTLISIAEQGDSPEEQLARMNALIGMNATKKLDEAGLSLALYLSKQFPDLLLTETFSSAIRTPLVDLMMGETGVKTVEEIAESAAGSSISGAQAAAKAAVSLMDSGAMLPEFFTAFKESQKRSGFGVVDGPAFRAIIGKNTNQIKKLAASDPAFKVEVEDWLSSDLQMTVTGIQQRLPKGVSLSFQNGRFTLMPDAPGTLPPNMTPGFGLTPLQAAENTLPANLNLKVLNEKMASLGLLGELGKPIFEAIAATYGPVVPQKGSSNEELGAKLKNIQPTQGTLPIAPGQMATAFASAEQEVGLPSGYLTTLAAIESNFDTNADNLLGSGAAGIFQIMPSTARSFGVTDPKDFGQSMKFIKEFTVKNASVLRDALGREPLPYELYMSHQQGATGAKKLLTADPSALAVDVLGSKEVTMNGGTANMTVAEFTNVWAKKWAAKSGQGPAGMPYSVAETMDSPQAPRTSVRSGRPTGSPTEGLKGMDAARVAQGAQTPSVAPPTAAMSEADKKQINGDLRTGKLTNKSIKALLAAMGEDPDSIPVFDTEAQFNEAVRKGSITKGQTVVVNGVMKDA